MCTQHIFLRVSPIVFVASLITHPGKSGKDLPAEFVMDDVYNAERDLVNKDDVKAVKDALTGKNEEK